MKSLYRTTSKPRWARFSTTRNWTSRKKVSSAEKQHPPGAAGTDFGTAVQYENREVVGSKDSKADSKSDLEDIITQDWTQEEETALRRKIDRRIVPLVTLLYLLCVCPLQASRE